MANDETRGVDEPSVTRTEVSRRRLIAGAAAIGVGSVLAGQPGTAVAKPRPRLIKLSNNCDTDRVIVVGAAEGAVVQHAALELSTYLEQITGCPFPVVNTANGSPAIAVGRLNEYQSALTGSSALPPEDPERDGFSFRTTGANVLIAGVSPRGTLYGANYFLDRLLGVRWYAPE